MLSLTVLSLGRIPSRFFLQKEKAELGGQSQPPQIASGWFRAWTELLPGHSHWPSGPDWPLMTRSFPPSHWGLSFMVPPELRAEPRRPRPAKESRAFGDGSACLLPPPPQAAKDRHCAHGLPDQKPPPGAPLCAHFIPHRTTRSSVKQFFKI